MDVLVEIAVLIALFALNGFFAMAELAVVSSRRIRLQQMADEGHPGAAQALALADNPGQLLSAVQVGITLIGILSGAFGGATLGQRLGPLLDEIPHVDPYGNQLAVVLVVVAITAVSVVMGELVPKQVALSAPEIIASRMARPLDLLSRVFRPFVWILERSSTGLLRLLGVPARSAASVTEEEVRFTIAEGTEAGVIAKVEQQMIHGVLALADRPVVAEMTPRPDVYWIDLDDEPAQIAREVAECPYSRLVVARGGDLGRPLGVMQKKDLVEDLIAGKGLHLEPHLREPVYVPENVSVLRMLEMFRKVSLHVAFVVDEYGDFLGIITLTDVLSAIAGDLPEEHEPMPEDITPRADGTFLVDGRVPIDELALKFGLPAPGAEFHTAAGLALERLARIPVEGDTFAVGDWRVEVIDMDGRRIDKLLFTPPTKA
ncbi:MAG: HlyC/CorC family transporter [Rhodoplanes sp.]|uniref:hemolysin family protein n=1 Tax=Rhodoplanes sp. TaxID=1968906 RepID=UPI001856564E|nr:hemolysin family protein [Rhodoplanes sp.]NVO14562.1 HlyC/CorC family transporter [Rhodoplanes sp.]